LSLELFVYMVSSQFSEFLVSRRHVRSDEPPRPVGPRLGVRWREGASPSVRKSVRPSSFFNSSVQHACFRSINVMLEMSFTIVFIVSSSVQSIINAIRAVGQTINSPYSRKCMSRVKFQITKLFLYDRYVLYCTDPCRIWSCSTNGSDDCFFVVNLWLQLVGEN